MANHYGSDNERYSKNNNPKKSPKTNPLIRLLLIQKAAIAQVFASKFSTETDSTNASLSFWNMVSIKQSIVITVGLRRTTNNGGTTIQYNNPKITPKITPKINRKITQKNNSQNNDIFDLL